MVKNGRINQSIALWCYEEYFPLPKLCAVAKELGCPSVELVYPEDWPLLKEQGLVCGMAYSHWFDVGMNNPEHQPACFEKLRESIDACAEYNFPNVITFTGPSDHLTLEEGFKNCVAGYKEIVGYAEEKNVTLCLEMLNSRVTTEMQGHPGYQGDHTDYVMDIIKAVGSPALKILFDVYHVQIMDGDIIARIREYGDYVGHYHVAGVPGRAEIGTGQEVNYAALMEAIVETGYTGYVGHEFLPQGDAMESLREAVAICDV